MDNNGVMENKKRLLIYAHYYAPDVASTGQILKELAEGMKDTFDVTVICVVPSYTGKIEERYKKQSFYKEDINGIHVLRVRVSEYNKENKLSRVKNILGYFFGSMAATFRVGKQDFVFSISQPPVLGGMLGVWGKWMKHAKYIYNIQDFNPEQIMAVKYSNNKFLLKIMMALDKFSCRHSELVVTVGRDLVETLNNRFKGKKVPKTALINNWINEKEVYPLAPEDERTIAFKRNWGLEGKFVIMYSGNIGLYYDLENMIKVIGNISPDTRTIDGREVVFAFIGSGAVLDKIKTYVKQHHMENVIFIPYQNKEDLIFSLNAADVHWCINGKGIKGVSVPSKFYGIAAVAKPVLGVLEKESEIRLIIEETRCGLVSVPEDYERIEKNIRWFIDNAGSAELSEMGRRGHEYLVENLTKDISIEKYKNAILNCDL